MRVNTPELDEKTVAELQEAKKTLKQMIIEEKGEDYYYELVAERIKWVDEVKQQCDSIFGQNDEKFRNEVRIVIANSNDTEDMKLYNFVITEIAMDTIID